MFSKSELQTFGILLHPPSPSPAQPSPAGNVPLLGQQSRTSGACAPASALPASPAPGAASEQRRGHRNLLRVPCSRAKSAEKELHNAPGMEEGQHREGRSARCGGGWKWGVNPLPPGCKSFPRLLRGFLGGCTALVAQRTQPQPCCSSLLPTHSLINHPVTPASFFSDAHFTQALYRFWVFLP